MLLFKPTPTNMQWAQLDDHHNPLQSGLLTPELTFPASLQQAVEESEQAVYLLEHGGMEIDQEVMELTPGVLNLIQAVQKYAPFENTLLMNLLFQMVTMRPDLQHILLCNTAFFHPLPRTARMYALPQSLQYPEIQRYGAHGLYHQAGYQHLRTAFPERCDRVISVFLDDVYPSTAVLQRGIPLDCSSGFSRLEGISGLSSVGSTDPALTLQLLQDGLTPDQVLQTLTLQSGHRSRHPELLSLQELYQDAAPEKLLNSRQMLQIQLRKQIGSGMAVLNGAQQILLLSTDLQHNQQFIQEIAQAFAPLGAVLQSVPAQRQDAWLQWTTDQSPLGIQALEISPWKIMADSAAAR